MRRIRAFTLIELLVVAAIIALLISILMPALSRARDQSRNVKCLANIRSMGAITSMYLGDNRHIFPVRDNAAPGGGSNFNAFLPSRTILRADRRPADIFACPNDDWEGRLYQAGDGTVAYPDSLGIGPAYELAPDARVRYSYGINNMTGINPTTEAERKLFNNKLSAYPYPARTTLYADSTFFNARAHLSVVNDEPRLKARVANAGLEALLNTLTNVPVEWGTPREEFRRHPKGTNVIFMDLHAEAVTQQFAFERLLYSWTEPALQTTP